MATRNERKPEEISIHAPRGGSDDHGAVRMDGRGISIHAPRGGSDVEELAGGIRQVFQSTLPVGGATPPCSPAISPGIVFQSTLPVGGATAKCCLQCLLRRISIHAPRGGSDVDSNLRSIDRIISIHAPRGGSDQLSSSNWPRTTYFNPRSPWGERPLTSKVRSSALAFQSTLPVGGATSYHHQTGREQHISIHAPRGGSDFPGSTDSPGAKNFNPRSPWGERLHANNEAFLLNIISIHAPRGGSDPQYQAGSAVQQAISIHAPRGGSDSKAASRQRIHHVFQSTLPVGGATQTLISYLSAWRISIHAPRGGSDLCLCRHLFSDRRISIHAPRGGSDVLGRRQSFGWIISIHAPRGGSDSCVVSVMTKQ